MRMPDIRNVHYLKNNMIARQSPIETTETKNNIHSMKQDNLTGEIEKVSSIY